MSIRVGKYWEGGVLYLHLPEKSEKYQAFWTANMKEHPTRMLQLYVLASKITQESLV